MKKEFGDYRRLAKGEFGCSSLWAGSEHLLYIKGTGLLIPVVEEYSRFPYAKIQAVTWAPTATALIWNLVFGFLLLLGGLPAVFVAFALLSGGFDDPNRVGMLVMFLILSLPLLVVGLVGLVLNLVFGRSGVFAIQTAGGSVRIRAVRRARKARHVMDEAARLVESHRAQVRTGRPSPAAAPSGSPAAAPVPPAEPASPVGRVAPPESEPRP